MKENTFSFNLGLFKAFFAEKIGCQKLCLKMSKAAVLTDPQWLLRTRVHGRGYFMFLPSVVFIWG